jgi:catechol 2,3-dioxygenase-like lactoylglutathione lyase family enzyme
MATLDHTIVPAKDRKESAEFYARVLGFEDLGERAEEIHGVRVNETTILFFQNYNDEDAKWAQGVRHLAFQFDRDKFVKIFDGIRSSGIEYGSSYEEPSNMKGPEQAIGARGKGDSIYFRDPGGNLVQVMTY